MGSRKRKGTGKQRRNTQSSRAIHASTTDSKSPKEEVRLALQAERQLRDPRSTLKKEESHKTQPSSHDAWWLSSFVALGTITVTLVAVFIPRGLGYLSILVAAISVLGMFSPQTPFGRRLNKVFEEKVINGFFQHLSVGLRGWVCGLGIIAVFLICTYIDFMKCIGSLLLCIYAYALMPLFFSLLSKERKLLVGSAVLLLLLLLTGIMLSVGALCKYQISHGSFDDMYATVSKRGALGDRMMPQALTMAAYADLYRRNYTHSAAVGRFEIALGYYQEDYDLAAMVSWRTERGTYIFGEDTLDRLREVGIRQSILKRLTPLQGKSFAGAPAFERALRERIEDADLASALEQLFEFSSRSEQKAREVGMKRAWREYRQALQDPLVISETEAEVRASAEAAATPNKANRFPWYLQPWYAISTLFLVGADQLSALSAILKVLTAWSAWRLLDYGSSIFLATSLLVLLFICWIFSKWVKAYNAKHDQSYAVNDGSFLTFFATITFFSLFIAFLTF